MYLRDALNFLPKTEVSALPSHRFCLATWMIEQWVKHCATALAFCVVRNCTSHPLSSWIVLLILRDSLGTLHPTFDGLSFPLMLIGLEVNPSKIKILRTDSDPVIWQVFINNQAIEYTQFCVQIARQKMKWCWEWITPEGFPHDVFYSVDPQRNQVTD